MTLNEVKTLAETIKSLVTWISSFTGISGLTVNKTRAKCHKCGGQGGSSAWSHTGWICFRCGGSGFDPSHYDHSVKGKPTSEFVASCVKKAASRDKRRVTLAAKKEAKAKAEQEAFDAEVEANPAIKEAIELHASLNSFGQDVVSTILRNKTWSQKQEDALIKNIEFSKEAKVSKAKIEAENAKSEFVGEVKQRIDLTVTVIKTLSFEGFYGITTLILMKDAEGNIFKWMASGASKDIIEGIEITIKATIKDHSVYNDAKQTVLARCKVQSVKEVL